ncbi:MAG TPA: sugar phosphate isomerase/epimerase family protein [Conexibacter sp.]|jgi:sugar phosphate isomerase/epimerase
MRLACGDHSFPLLGHEQVCDLVRMLGFDGLDIGLMGNRSHVRPEVVRRDVAGWAGRLSERVRGRGLDIADVFVIPWTEFEVMAPNHPDREERRKAAELFADMLELTVRLEARGMTTVPGIAFPGEDRKTSLARACDELSWRVAAAAERGVQLSIEPHLGSIAADPADALRLVENTPGLTLTLDHGHFVAGGYDERDADPLIPHTRHLHARGAVRGRLQAPMGENAIDFERIVTALAQTGYDGWLAVEYVWVDWERCNECDNLSETILLRDQLRAALQPRMTATGP